MTGWVISWGTHKWTDDDVLAGDAATVQALTEGTWVNCDPWRGPIELMAYLATFIARTYGVPVEPVLDRLRAMPLATVQESIRLRKDEPNAGVREPLRPVPNRDPAKAAV